jgi:cell volume regulation protein A
MFLTLGLLVNPREMLTVWIAAVAIGFFMMLVARPAAVFLTLIPFRIPARAKVFLSWVGLRGAVPIIFATYPVIADIENAHVLFNVVFIITLLSLLFQGTTIATLARKLKLDLPAPKEGNEFGVELPDELGSQLEEQTLKEEDLANGNHLADMNFANGTLVMMIKRGNSFIVPNGKLELYPGDILLSISNLTKDSSKKQKEVNPAIK